MWKNDNICRCPNCPDQATYDTYFCINCLVAGCDWSRCNLAINIWRRKQEELDQRNNGERS